MKDLSIRPSQPLSSIISSTAIGLGLTSLLIAPAIAQQRPAANTNLCSTATQSCSNAILSEGPLSVSAGESSQLNINRTRAVTLEQISNEVNEQTELEEASTRLGIGILDINSGDRDRLGVRDNVRD